jgi:hypothetical protein
MEVFVRYQRQDAGATPPEGLGTAKFSREIWLQEGEELFIYSIKPKPLSCLSTGNFDLTCHAARNEMQ